jgi:hypothetical protein
MVAKATIIIYTRGLPRALLRDLKNDLEIVIRKFTVIFIKVKQLNTKKLAEIHPLNSNLKLKCSVLL